MRNNNVNESTEKTWTSREAYLLAMVTLFCGLIIGYLFHGSSTAPDTATAATPAPSTVPATPSLQSPEQLNVMVQPLLEASKARPNDPGPLVELGNTYYDHQFFTEAIKYYEKALVLKPGDANVRTDMATAMFYSGSAQRAVTELEKVLKDNPTHANALFNLGVVKRDGLEDPKGAAATWERLLSTNPDYPQKEKVRDMIAKAKSRG